MRNVGWRKAWITAILCLLAMPLLAGEPVPKPENTISLRKGEPVKPQTFARPLKFFVDKVVDRSGNPKPMMMLERRGGVFIDREPALIVREAVEDSLKTAGILASEAAAADYILDIYVFHFGLGESSGMETFGKVELGVILKDPKTGKSQNISALGTSIKGVAIRKRSIMKDMQANLQDALQDVMRNFLRGVKLRDAVAALSEATPATTAPAMETTPTPPPSPADAPAKTGAQ